MLATVDANSDGEITADEMANAVEALRKLDKNSDGELASDELMPFRGPGGPGGAMRRQTMKVLEKFDVDKDGVLRKEERAEARKAPGRRTRGRHWPECAHCEARRGCDS